jgi:hypothetical protein
MAIDEAGHDDRQTTATVADRLFDTLATAGLAESIRTE